MILQLMCTLLILLAFIIQAVVVYLKFTNRVTKLDILIRQYRLNFEALSNRIEDVNCNIQLLYNTYKNNITRLEDENMQLKVEVEHFKSMLEKQLGEYVKFNEPTNSEILPNEEQAKDLGELWDWKEKSSKKLDNYVLE